jgi:hypothetical protein
MDLSHRSDPGRRAREGKRSFQELIAPDLENANSVMQDGRNVPSTARGTSGMQMGCFATLQL